MTKRIDSPVPSRGGVAGALFRGWGWSTAADGYRVCRPAARPPSPPMSFTVKAHHERYYAVFVRETMEDALAKANELVDEGYSAVTIQDENRFLYLQSDFSLLAENPTTKQ
jgi:hypothetical protein